MLINDMNEIHLTGDDGYASGDLITVLVAHVDVTMCMLVVGPSAKKIYNNDPYFTVLLINELGELELTNRAGHWMTYFGEVLVDARK